MKITGLKTLGLALSVGLAWCLYGCSNTAQNNSQTATNAGQGKNGTAATKTDSADDVTEGDESFMHDAAQINLLEIKVGKLAQKTGSLDDVKQMGKMLEEDHTRLQNKLKELAKKIQMTLPDSLDGDLQHSYDKLSSKKGNDFDKSFTKDMIDGHKDAITVFERESNETKNADLKKYASESLPVLHKHLDEANRIKGKMKNLVKAVD